MTKIVVAGVVSFYAAAPIGVFPVAFESLRYPPWLHFGVGGVGFHVSRVLSGLGDDVRLCSVVGLDSAGSAIRDRLREVGLFGGGVVDISESSTGVVLVADDGARTVLPYLDGVRAASYPVETFAEMATGADLAVMTNIDFVAPLLPVVAELGVPVAVDVHMVADLDGGNDLPWLEHAQILFCSNEKLPCSPHEWVRGVLKRYQAVELVVVGCGALGSVLGSRCGRMIHASAVAPLGVYNTTGAGDSLFGSFVHVWANTGDFVHALRAATVYAGWKIGHRVPGEVTPDQETLDELLAYHPVELRVSTWN